jgi:hypothetical protein
MQTKYWIVIALVVVLAFVMYNKKENSHEDMSDQNMSDQQLKEISECYSYPNQMQCRQFK